MSNNTFGRGLLLAGLAVLAVAAIAYAHGPGNGYGYGHMGYGNGYHMMGDGYGPGYGRSSALDQLSPEQREAYQELADQHFEKMNGLRDQMIVLRNKLDDARDTATVANLRTEMDAVAGGMHDEAAAFGDQVRQQFGIEGFGPGSGMGYGPGYGMMGYGGCPGWDNR